MICLVS